MHVHHQYAMVDGLRVHAVTSRRPGSADPPVDALFVHGVGGTAWTFEATLQELPAVRGWASVDLFGYGESSWLDDGDYSTARQAAALAAMLDELAVSAMHVVGFSWGGLVGLELASRDPRVRKLAMVDIPPSTSQTETDVPAIPAQYASMDDVCSAVRQLAPRAGDTVVERDALHSTRPSADGWEKKIDPRLLRRWQFRAENHWSTLRALPQEVLVVRAEHSPVLSEEVATDMVAQCPHASLAIIRDSGHLVPLERPHKLAEVLDGFLS